MKARRTQGALTPSTKAANAMVEKTRGELVDAIEDSLRTVAGVKTNKMAWQLATQVMNLQLWNKGDEARDYYITAASFLAEMKIETATEGMLAVQMIGVHQQATMLLARANAEGQSFEGVKECSLLAIRLMRLFNDQAGAMAKLKGKVPRQKVTVEHVHVHEGGQAIVGAVSSTKGASPRSGGS